MVHAQKEVEAWKLKVGTGRMQHGTARQAINL
jgi:hypothetical protein